ncbi:jg2805 [Pararge aegeria aegeria]|uniref:Jg2805 protein n=1 Tax=Pararge aegeria aegeria TaxID=348720 RepID=A0A8S4QLB9_9NEOP|nr:jg2805 [Pararge aegeria aegeria]
MGGHSRPLRCGSERKKQNASYVLMVFQPRNGADSFVASQFIFFFLACVLGGKPDDIVYEATARFCCGNTFRGLSGTPQVSVRQTKQQESTCDTRTLSPLQPYRSPQDELQPLLHVSI